MKSESCNRIEIQGLEVYANVGVPEQERATPQRLLLDVELELGVSFSAMEDCVERTVDYDCLSKDLSEFVAERPRKLIETLAFECANWMTKKHPVVRAKVRVRKFILPETEFVAVVSEVSV